MKHGPIVNVEYSIMKLVQLLHHFLLLCVFVLHMLDEKIEEDQTKDSVRATTSYGQNFCNSLLRVLGMLIIPYMASIKWRVFAIGKVKGTNVHLE